MNAGPLFTPTTARDLHRSFIEWWQSREAQQYADLRADYAADNAASGQTRASYYTEINPVAERRRLTAAETFLVTDEMSAVCRHAAMTLPSLVVEHAMLPAEIGFILFNDRTVDHADGPTERVLLEAACWYPTSYGGHPGVAVSTYILPDSMISLAGRIGQHAPQDYAATVRRLRAPLVPALWTFLPYGVEPEDEATNYEFGYVVGMLMSAWLLMDQPISRQERPRIARSTEKRAIRAGLVSDLTVVMLRQPRSEPGSEPAGREYHRRWIVRGHWRRIPTPESPYRVTWVHGYVKGPADAPLVVTDRVTVLAR